ncbi:acyl-protein synthetase [Corynespora cassiicola Philippines]|uniref:Acyl-protein synthetase n=1 Tax=Corynespora cassiicola Philippines TaxID=1448308 RepID=A0A2T2P2G4_CORCC|nr:acyl-protein synthetase [Corynespora cassiicola Philippines]
MGLHSVAAASVHEDPVPHTFRIHDLLRKAARSSHSKSLIIYPHGETDSSALYSYAELYREALHISQLITQIENFQPGAPVLLHLDTHWEIILWFWAIVLADGLPVLSSPFSHVSEHRHRHIQNLSKVLDSPICISQAKSIALWDCKHGMKLHTIESLSTKPILGHSTLKPVARRDSDLAILMLTSGSTGNSKAVQITHRQILASVAGKASVRELPSGKPFLNWIGLDHVASLIEIHLQALYLQVPQVHVHAVDVVSEPLTFLDLLSRHEVARSFAPNFFLAKLVTKYEQMKKDGENIDLLRKRWNLRALSVLASGGEANDVRICVAASELLSALGAPANVITTGFGMTETCAGSIFNLDCPNFDVKEKRAFASLGRCMKGIEMRVVCAKGRHEPNEGSEKVEERVATSDEIGELQVRGDVVFNGYYQNSRATMEAFAPGGWFRTGDQARIDSSGNLHLVGRLNDTINVNGVKISSADIQKSLERALCGSVATLVVFATRLPTVNTEQITVAYEPSSCPSSRLEAFKFRNIISSTVIAATGSQPVVFSLDKESSLPKSTLGKISRPKMRALYENGHFDVQIQKHQRLIESSPRDSVIDASEYELLILQDLQTTLGLDTNTVHVDSSFFELGIDSMALVSLKRKIESRLRREISIATLINNPTVRLLTQALEISGVSQQDYNPVIALRKGGSKTPLWLVHPGVGEVLVFVGLSSLIDGRPVYALRARGFDGETPFTDLNDMVETYYSALRSHQPSGPYAIAGYSYGSMIAFELAKRLEKNGQDVGFLGSFNLPPHIKQRMRQLNWNMCLLHLSFFLGMTTEEFTDNVSSDYHTLPRQDALSIILRSADRTRMVEIGLTEGHLAKWADIAYSLQSLAVEYEPSGSVAVMDIFHAKPLAVAAKSRKDWIDNHLSRWKDYTRKEPKFHKVEGAHYTMISPEYVEGFALTLNRVLEERGL